MPCPDSVYQMSLEVIYCNSEICIMPEPKSQWSQLPLFRMAKSITLLGKYCWSRLRTILQFFELGHHLTWNRSIREPNYVAAQNLLHLGPQCLCSGIFFQLNYRWQKHVQWICYLVKTTVLDGHQASHRQKLRRISFRSILTDNAIDRRSHRKASFIHNNSFSKEELGSIIKSHLQNAILGCRSVGFRYDSLL